MQAITRSNLIDSGSQLALGLSNLDNKKVKNPGNPKYLLLYLQSIGHEEGKFWEHGEIAGAILGEDLSLLKDLGTTIAPDPNEWWKSHRLLAGKLWLQGNQLYLFYGGTPNHPHILQESVGLCKGTINDELEIEWGSSKPLEFIGWENYYEHSPNLDFPEQPHRQWRDPWIVFERGKYWMFLSASAKTNSPFYKGCVGLAVADNLEGSYTVLPPAAFPCMGSGKDERGLVTECERSHIIYKNGMWHLFFSVWKNHINPQWLEQLGTEADAISDSSLHHYISSQLQGPYRPASEVPIVRGSSETGLYATHFSVDPDSMEDAIAYGLELETFALDVSGQWKVLWDDGYPEIKKGTPFHITSSLTRSLELHRQGYQLWDAMLLELPS